MTPQTLGLLTIVGSVILATTAFGADPAPAPESASTAATPAQTEAEKAEAEKRAQEAARAAQPAGAGGAPMTPEQRLEAGKKAMQATCVDAGCHGPDKWQGAARDRENWTRTIDTMFTKMVEFEMPVPPPATYNLVLDYMVTTYPQ